MKDKKKFVIWGTGDRSTLFTETLESIEDLLFYVDNDITKEGNYFYGRKICHPSHIGDWTQYYIIVAIENNYESVKRQLESYGLIYGKDFIHYREALVGKQQIETLTNEVNSFLEKIKFELKNKAIDTVAFGAMAAFDPNCIKNFNALFAQKDKEDFLLLSENIKIDYCKEIVKFPYYVLPKIFLQDYYISKSIFGNIEKMDREICAKVEGTPYLKNALCVLKGKYKNIDKNYAVFLIYYCDIFVRAIFDILHPRRVVLWNQFYAFHLIIDSICCERNIKRVYMEFGVLPGTYVLETAGQMGESCVALHADKFKQLLVTKQEIVHGNIVWKYLEKSRCNRHPQPTDDNIWDEIMDRIDFSRPIILYAGQNDYDSGLYPYGERAKMYHSPVFSSSHDALLFLSSIAKQYDWNLIYKPHPLCLRNEANNKIPSQVILVKNCDINRLVDFSDVVVTILSTVSYVALVRERPVVMLGYTQLRGKGCTYEAFSRDMIAETIELATKDGFTDSQRRLFVKHISQLCKYYLFDDNGKRQIRFGRNLEDYWEERSCDIEELIE